jgi:serine/threonine protein kinase
MAEVFTDQPEKGYLHIGKYRVLAHIATGGMGVVYKAQDTELGREVALKVLPPELAVQPDKLERFRSEGRHGARMRHKNLAQIYECGEANGTYYLALELVDGVDLHEYVRQRGQLDPQDACQILLQALRALVYLHRHGMVHRDIKPSNFLISRHPTKDRNIVKLTDFGLARELDDREFQVTKDGTTVGTVDYMAPEQARNSRLADIRSDIYSLGCTFFHMLTGKPPYAEGGMVERLYQHLEGDVPDVCRLNPQVPEKLSALLRRMLAKKPADRYQTPAELLEDLLQFRKAARREARNAEPGPEPGPPPVESEEPPAPTTPHLPAPRPPKKARRKKVRIEPPSPARQDASSSSTENMLAVDYESSLLPAPNAEHQRAAAGQFNRAREVLQDGNHDYGIHLLRSCCKLDPANLGYRRALRQTEKSKFGPRRKGKRFSWLTTLPARTRLKAAKRGLQFVKVLEHGEEILAHNPWEVATQMDMAEAAEALGLINLAVWLLEEARDGEEKNAPLARALARLYERRGKFTKAIQLWDQVRKADPADLEAAQKITDLAARDTIARGRYEEMTEGQRLGGPRKKERP